MQKWEYCVVVGLSRLTTERYMHPDYPALWTLTPSGVNYKLMGKPESEELAKTIAQLGEEGWEMVGASGSFVYFKRPKS